jgi:hypothetical protein
MPQQGSQQLGPQFIPKVGWQPNCGQQPTQLRLPKQNGVNALACWNFMVKLHLLEQQPQNFGKHGHQADADDADAVIPSSDSRPIAKSFFMAGVGRSREGTAKPDHPPDGRRASLDSASTIPDDLPPCRRVKTIFNPSML